MIHSWNQYNNTVEISIKFLGRLSLIFIFIFGLYIFEFAKLNLIRFNPTDYLYILDMFDNINNTSKEEPIREVMVSVKIGQFHELVCNPIMRLSILIQIENINQRWV